MHHPVIFEHLDYRSFLKAWVAARPSQGRGELRRIAQFLRVHPTLVSQIVNAKKELSLEQALELGGYLQLAEPELDYFLCLVQLGRAGSRSLQAHFAAKLERMRVQSQDLSLRFENKVEMTEAERGEFYSNWHYAAVHLAVELEACRSLGEIARLLGLSERLVKEKVDFLLRAGLCVTKNGKLCIGPAWTYVDSKSPFVASHHRNWRLKAMERHQELTDTELAVTAPVALSREGAQQFRKRAVQLIEELKSLVNGGAPEELMVFNLDWVRFRTGPG